MHSSQESLVMSERSKGALDESVDLGKLESVSNSKGKNGEQYACVLHDF